MNLASRIGKIEFTAGGVEQRFHIDAKDDADFDRQFECALLACRPAPYALTGSIGSTAISMRGELPGHEDALEMLR